MQIPRLFTHGLDTPYSDQQYEPRVSEIREPDGRVVFRQENVMVPRDWSQVATDILAQKYFRRTGVPQKGGKAGGESDAREVFHRLAGCWTDWGKRHGYFTTEADATHFYDEIRYMLSHQMVAPNSPQWFNTGLHFAYGIDGPAQGHYYVDPKTKKLTASKSAYEHPQPSACFIQSVEDNLVNGNGIMDLWTREARLYKYGSGSGSNFSSLRGRGEKLSGGGRSSGLMSFLKIGDVAAGAIQSGGTTRRAAKMVCLDLDHPEVESFINWKVIEEQKVSALVAGARVHRERLTAVMEAAVTEHGVEIDPHENEALKEALLDAREAGIPDGYLMKALQLASQGKTSIHFPAFDTDWQGEAYHTVSGQNANNSVRVPNEFFRLLETNGDWQLKNRLDGAVAKTIPARALWDEITYAAWASADPGVQCDTTINEWHTCPSGGRINASNPCFTGDTRILTERGWKRIDSLVEAGTRGEFIRVLRRDGTPSTPTQLMVTGINPILKVKLSDGRELRTTPNHTWILADGNRKPASELVLGDTVPVISEPVRYDGCWELPFEIRRNLGERALPTMPVRWTLELGEILGHLVGDGCIDAAGVTILVYGTRDDERIETADRHKEWLSALFGLEITDTQVGNGCRQLRVCRRAVGRFFATLGVSSSRAHDKRLPDVLFEAPREIVAAFLRGYFGADGTCYGREEMGECEVSAASASEGLLRDVQLLLQLLGIRSRLSLMRGSEKESFDGYQSRPCYRLRVHTADLELFDREVGFSVRFKLDMLRDLLVSRKRIKSKPFEVSVVSIEKEEEELTYNLTEPEEHAVWANGIYIAQCSEYMFLDDTACNLASVNLLRFLNEKNGELRLKEFQHACRLWTVVLEISVLMGQFPSKAIAERSYEYRTIGLGYANLGALLMSLGIPYGSSEALAATGAISALMTGESYAASAEMAKELGAFPRYAENREPMLRVMRNHRRAAYAAPAGEYESLSTLPTPIDAAKCPVPLLQAARAAWDRALALGDKHGYRNAQATVIAPTGTIGLLMDCDTTGIEPDFALVKFKKLAGGGYFRIINQSVPRALAKLGYTPKQTREIVAYCAGYGTLTDAPFINPRSLKPKGFTDEVLRKVEERLAGAFALSFAFTPGVVGEAFCTDRLGIASDRLEAPGFDLLQEIGFTADELEAANLHVFGTSTVEGAPHLKEEHLPVFDCATRCGLKGTRYLPVAAHIDMMAAAQPFVSGAISKTINMPVESTIGEVGDALLDAAKKMVKAISVYRDGSKLSQPLSAGLAADLFRGLERAPKKEAALRAAPAPVGRGLRRELPKRRFGYTVKATIGGQRIYLRTGEYEDGRLGEIFVDIYKEGAAYRSLMNAFAISISMGLQYGVPLEEYLSKFHMFRFEPNGHVADHDNIKFCSSIIDFIFRDLALNYLGRHDLVHVPPEGATPREAAAQQVDAGGGVQAALPSAQEPISAAPSGEEEPTDVALTREEWADDRALKSRLARTRGYEGDPCTECGQFTMVRGGTCLRCLSCGATSGCS